MKNATTKRSASEASSPKGRIRFHTAILQAGNTATGIQIPDDVVEKLSSSKRPAVRVTINGYTCRSTVAVASNLHRGQPVAGEKVHFGNLQNDE